MNARPGAHRRVGALGVTAAAVASLALPMAATPAHASSTVQTASDRVDNLRFEHIDSGPLAGRLVLAGRFDHVGNTEEQQVRVRITLRSRPGTDAASVIGRKVLDYDLPAGAAPQDSPLRWLLTRSQSRAVRSQGDAAVVAVDIWQHGVAGEHVTRGHRHSATATRLDIHGPSSKERAASGRSSDLPMLLPNILYEGSGVIVFTSEDWGMNVYVSQVYGTTWSAQPSWSTSTSPIILTSSGPGSGFPAADGTWSIQSTLGAAGCAAADPTQMAVTGQFIDQGGAVDIAWADLRCPWGMPDAPAGSASGLQWPTG